jgi:hypothetical protein
MNTGIRYCPVHDGEYRSLNKHRNICPDCKDRFPFKASGKGFHPFNRIEIAKRKIK